MDCQEAVGRLPWLLNGSLEPEEAARVRSHLESCPACRGELGETRWAAAVFGAHAPAEALVAMAWDRPAEGLDLDLVRRHVKGCAACAEELAMARESRALETPATVAPMRPRVPWAVRYGPLAAAVLVALGTGVLWRSDRGRLDGRVAELEQEVERRGEAEAALLERVRRAESPEPNLAVVELLPDSAVSRSAPAAETRVIVPAGARSLALLLGSDKATGPASVELRSASGEVLWTGHGLQPNALGGYTLGLPVSLLAEGRYTLTLRPARGRAETYTLRVEWGR